MDFGFVGCLAFSNYFKLPHVIRLSFARTAFFYMFFDGTFTSLMAFLLKEHIKKCSSCKTQPNNIGQFKIIRKCQTSYEAKGST